MILSALVKRYEEMPDAAPQGWQTRDASYALDIDDDGRLLDIILLGDHSKKRGRRSFSLPTIGKGRQGSKAYETAYFLCDDGNYMLGLDSIKYDSARKLHTALLEHIDTPVAKAIFAYFSAPPPEILPEKNECYEAVAKYVFMYHDECIDYFNCGDEIRNVWNSTIVYDGPRSRCLVTGNHDEIISLHNPVSLQGVTMGSKPLISMNNQKSFRSYGKKPGDPPAEVGQYAAFAYATALDAMLKDRKHSQKIGIDTLVFWAEKGGEEEEGLFADMMSPPKIDEDKNLTDTIYKIVRGEYVADYKPERIFYLLCLSPNAGRISVRFFHVGSFGDLIKNICSHYNRLEIINDNRTPFPILPIWLILSETTMKKTAADAAPLLGGQLLRCVLTGMQYPSTLYNAIFTRIRAGEEINMIKAAVVKAVLINNYKESEVTTVALNEQSVCKPYVLGRLFSVLERLQEAANNSSTIRSRYFSSACANPGSVFPTLLNLSMHHSAKLGGAYFEILKSDLLSRLDDIEPFPAVFNMDDQGRFILGYYHQRQDFFTKKDKEVTINE
jgi:CRISPR-associated protein Csd1